MPPSLALSLSFWAHTNTLGEFCVLCCCCFALACSAAFKVTHTQRLRLFSRFRRTGFFAHERRASASTRIPLSLLLSPLRSFSLCGQHTQLRRVDSTSDGDEGRQASSRPTSEQITYCLDFIHNNKFIVRSHILLQSLTNLIKLLCIIRRDIVQTNTSQPSSH